MRTMDRMYCRRRTQGERFAFLLLALAVLATLVPVGAAVPAAARTAPNPACMSADGMVPCTGPADPQAFSAAFRIAAMFLP